MSEQPETYMTDELRSFIGCTAEPVTAWHTVEPSEVRRFVQAIMDDDPVFWNEEEASRSRYGAPVAPPLYPSFAFRRPPGSPDPLDAVRKNRDYDGAGSLRTGLPSLPIPLRRILNGGVEAQFLALAHHGDTITAQSRYSDIYERNGRDGKMVFIVTETTYTNQDGQVLAKIRNTGIRR